ncbi:hypothetical protein MTYP_01502 [Methylophilaceae bacterium]|nr:hypothetical protein MTYP_01502 [Methylophilaceae bacterium]
MLRLTFVLMAIIWVGEASAANIAMPDCGALKNWTQDVVLPSRGNNHAQREKAVQSVWTITTDEKTAPLFGKPYSQWEDNDFANFQSQIETCRQATYNPSDGYVAQKMNFVLYTIQKDTGKKPKKPNATLVDVSVKKPDCTRIAEWALGGGSFPDGTSLEKRQAWMFEDHNTAALFGLGFSQWNIYDRALARKYIVACHGEMFPRGTSVTTDGGRKTIMGFQMAESYIANVHRRLGEVSQLSHVMEQLEQFQ